jgi:hypothetical protein
MRKLLILAVGGLLIWQLLSRDNSIELGPGVRAAQDPVQENLDSPQTFTYDAYRITPLAGFRLRAKILSRETYGMGRESELSPIDLALGWGRMSDESVLQHIDISQSGRWYLWRTREYPIPRREIETHSANMHIIPADQAVADIIDDFPRGDIIELDGYLVRADADDGWRWVSSLSREDTGARACELFYVRRARAVY